jgi:hypothetical protein
MLPDQAANLAAWLPLGTTEVSRENYGGAVRVEIQGGDITDGKNYQLVVTDGPLMRCIELVENPHQDG